MSVISDSKVHVFFLLVQYALPPGDSGSLPFLYDMRFHLGTQDPVHSFVQPDLGFSIFHLQDGLAGFPSLRHKPVAFLFRLRLSFLLSNFNTFRMPPFNITFAWQVDS